MHAKLAGFALVALASVTAVGSWLTRTEYKTLAPATYYVDPTGNNANACTVAGTSACANLSGVFAKLPPRILHNVTVFVAAGTYSDAPNLNGNEVLGNISIIGPALINVTPTTGSATGTLTAVANTAPAVLGDSAATWTVNDLIGRHVLIGSSRRVIASNTATTLTLASPFGATPAIGAAYSIQRQGATFTSSTTDATLSLRMSGSGTPAGGIIIVSVSGIEFVNTSGSYGDAATISLSVQLLTFSNSRFSAPSNGLSYAGPGGVVSLGASAYLGGVSGVLYGSSGIILPFGGGLTISNSFLYGSTGPGFSAAGAGGVAINGSSGWTAQTNSASNTSGAFAVSALTFRTGTSTGVPVFRCLQAGPAGAIQSFTTTPNTSTPLFFTLENLYIDGCSTGIDFSQGMGNALATVTSSLTCNNTATCINVANGSRFRVPSTWTLNGVTSEIVIDGTTYTRATLLGATPTRVPASPSLTGSSVWQ